MEVIIEYDAKCGKWKKKIYEEWKWRKKKKDNDEIRKKKWKIKLCKKK